MKRKAAEAAGAALYAYLIGRAGDVQKAGAANRLPGMEEDAEIQIIIEGDVAAVVSAVPLEKYGEGRFERQLEDPAWTASRVMRHQAVAEFFSSRHPVIPLRFGAMYSSADNIRQLLRDRAEAFNRALDRVEGCEEWGLNVYVEKTVLSGKLDALSPKLAELKQRASKASQGQAYLLQKQAEKMRAGEMKSYVKETSTNIAEELKPMAESLKRMPVSEVEGKQEPAVAGKLAYLVKKTKVRAFKAAAEKLAAKYGTAGFKFELTGPWPPYHFVE